VQLRSPFLDIAPRHWVIRARRLGTVLFRTQTHGSFCSNTWREDLGVDLKTILKYDLLKLLWPLTNPQGVIFQMTWTRSLGSLTVKMEAPRSAEVSIALYHSARCNFQKTLIFENNDDTMTRIFCLNTRWRWMGGFVLMGPDVHRVVWTCGGAYS
jgi:hypothetical protein